MVYLGGQPHLVHLLLYHVARDPTSADRLFDARTLGDGIFQDHLRRFLSVFQQEETLSEAMKNISNSKGCSDFRLRNRLESLGLIRQNQQQEWEPLCHLYRDFFARELQ